MLPVNSVKIDWLRFSLPFSSLNPVLAFIGLPHLVDWSQVKRYRKNFSYYFADGCLLASDILFDTVLQEVPNGRFILDFSGSGIGNYFASLDAFSDFVSFILSLPDSRCTRLDIAYDDVSRLLRLRRIASYLKSRHVITRWRDFYVNERNAIGGDSYGRTIYLGNRRSNSFARIYDKRAKSLLDGLAAADLPDHWIRFELELKGAVSHAWLTAVHPAYDSGQACGLLSGLIEFVDRSSNPVLRRCSRTKWWDKFLSSASRDRLILPKPVRSIESVKAWLSRSVAPSLALISLDGGGDLTFATELISSGASRLTPDKLSMLHGV